MSTDTKAELVSYKPYTFQTVLLPTNRIKAFCAEKKIGIDSDEMREIIHKACGSILVYGVADDGTPYVANAYPRVHPRIDGYDLQALVDTFRITLQDIHVAALQFQQVKSDNMPFRLAKIAPIWE